MFSQAGDTFEPAQLDNVCPHPIESKELLKWTSLDKLEQDFASFRKEINWFETRIKKGSRPFKKPAEEKCRELADIFVVPAKAGKTAKDIIDIRLCASIRFFECILRGIRIITSQDRWYWLLLALKRHLNIIHPFDHAGDTPDVRWFFKNRVMIFLLHEYSIDHWCLENDQPHRCNPRIKFLENHRFYIDEDDCFVIIKDIVFLQLDFVGWKSSERVVSDDIDPTIFWLDKASCPYYAMIQSLVDRHESMLKRSIQFSMKQLRRIDQRNQARRFLSILLKVAHYRKEWEEINTKLACLFSSPMKDIRAFAIRLFANLIEWNNDRDGTNFEMLSEHFDAMIELLESPSDKIQDANHYTWRCIGQLTRLIPREYQLLRKAVSVYLKRIDRIIQSGTSGLEPEGIREEYKTFCWLIMPRVNNTTGKFDLDSASNQLFEDLEIIQRRKEITISFNDDLKSVCREYKESLTGKESKNQFGLISGKASWLLAKRISLNSDLGYIRRGEDLVTSALCGGGSGPRSVRLSPASHLNHCKVMQEIHQHFYNSEQILHPSLCFRYLGVLVHLGPENEEKLRAIESCLLRAIELYPSRRGKFFVRVFRYARTCKPLRSAFRLVYHENQMGRRHSSSPEVSFPSRNDIQGIQSRRMLVVSLCKHLIADLDYLALPRMIDLIGELNLAYKLRSGQESTEQVVYLYLLPTCVELAFPTSFDDPNNRMYICEFSYFKDTMDYLRRNKPRELRRLYSRLSASKRKRLRYYQNYYDNFQVCCFTRRLDKERDRFRCIDHKISGQKIPQICPLLNRSPYCNQFYNLKQF